MGSPNSRQSLSIKHQGPPFRPDYRQSPNGSTRPQNLTSSTQGDCMAKVEPARCFPMPCLITRMAELTPGQHLLIEAPSPGVPPWRPGRG